MINLLAQRQLIPAQGENILLRSEECLTQISRLDMIRQKRSWGHFISTLVVYRITLEENLGVF